ALRALEARPRPAPRVGRRATTRPRTDRPREDRLQHDGERRRLQRTELDRQALLRADRERADRRAEREALRVRVLTASPSDDTGTRAAYGATPHERRRRRRGTRVRSLPSAAAVARRTSPCRNVAHPCRRNPCGAHARPGGLLP